MLAALIAASLAFQEPPPDPEAAEALREEAETLREAARARELAAEAASAEIARLQRRLVEAADRVRAREAEAEAAAAETARLEAEEDALVARLAAEREGLARVLAALQRIEQADPPALAVTPEDAVEAARAAALLARIAPELDARAAAVRDRLEELRRLRERLGDQAERLAQAREALATTRQEVTALVEERRAAEIALRAEADELSRRAAEIAAQAEDLDSLIAEIRRYAEATPRLAPRPEPAAVPDDGVPVPRVRPEPVAAGTLVDAAPLTGPAETLRFADMRGRLGPPVRGRLTIAADERGPDGAVRDGVWFETASRANVSAPFDGVVVYAGPFQSFEGVLMINTPDGYTLILAGLGLVYASEGQSLLAGEPVGVMPDRENPPPMLYLEIRRSSNAADDPELWLRPEFRKG
ncbi:MAG: peptidoglycan DD-metalloendopeptidase family protein [Oceanicaulis sp.]